MTLSGVWPTLHQRHGHSCHCHYSKGNKKVENKLEGMMVMGICFASTLPLWYGIIFPNSLATPPLWYLINFLVDGSLLSTNFSSYAQRSITNFSEYYPPWGCSAIWVVFLGSFLFLLLLILSTNTWGFYELWGGIVPTSEIDPPRPRIRCLLLLLI